MRYLSVKCVSSACNGCIDKTTNQFWGLLAILFAIDKEIEPTKTYTFVGGDVSAFLDELFSFGEKNRSDSEIIWYIIFSNIWKEYMLEKCIKNKPNIYDVAIWLFRKKTFVNEINAEGILKMFLETTHFKKEDLDSYFNFDERELSFEDYAYNDISLKEKLKEDYQLISSDDNQTLSFEKTKAKNKDNNKIVWSCIKYPAGNLTQAPFVQTLYSGQGIQKCILLTKFDLDSLYKRQKNKKVKDMDVLQAIYYGAPGTGKSHEVKKQTGELSVDNEDRDLPNVFRTTFHPDTDYASFVGCYKPSMRKTGKKHQVDGKDVDDEEIIYEFIPQTFTDAYVYAYKNPTEPTYLVIEEINRGNCAQIFGDLFQLLDRKNGVSEYRIKADKDLAKFLNEELGKDADGIKDGKLRLPANLNILATMNTSDQSLFPIDSAFKRRWDWVYTPIAQGKDKYGKSLEWQIEGQGENSWWTFIQGINEVIDQTTHSEDKKLGFFFCKDQNGVIKKETFVNKVVFYLWNDVFKVYGFKSEIFDKKGKDDKTEKITFKSFYKDDGSVNEETMSVFVKNVMAKAPKKNTNDDVSDESEEITEESGTET